MFVNSKTGPSRPEYVLQKVGKGWLVKVWVQPDAKLNSIAGVQDGRLKVRLAAPAVDNKANKALVAYFSQLLDLPRRHIVLARGMTGRKKTISIIAEEEPVWDRLIPARPRFGHNNSRSGDHGAA